MSERRELYTVPSLLKSQADRVIVNTELDLVRCELEELERRLIPLLVTVQRALGKEPTVLTPEQRRRLAVERHKG